MKSKVDIATANFIKDRENQIALLILHKTE